MWKVWTSWLSLVSRSIKSGQMFEKFTADKVLKSSSDRNQSLQSLFSDIILVFHMVCNNQDSNQESWESFSVGLLVTWLSNKPKNSSNYFFAFLSHYYGFTNYFETLTFLFLIPYWEEFQFVRTMYVKKYEAHKIIIYFSKKFFDVHKFNNLL